MDLSQYHPILVAHKDRSAISTIWDADDVEIFWKGNSYKITMTEVGEILVGGSRNGRGRYELDASIDHSQGAKVVRLGIRKSSKSKGAASALAQQPTRTLRISSASGESLDQEVAVCEGET